jgi:molybdate transport system ATP-binding protein
VLEARIRHAARGVELDVTVQDGERVAVMGPNGAGKSTMLEMVAGLVEPDEGMIAIDGRTMTDIGHRRRMRVRPHQRNVGLLTQESSLFTHLSVGENVAFGPRSSGVRRAAARAEARSWLAQVDAADLERRRPAELSGGQAQRVAVARALAASPRLLLLDEPLAALDVGAAAHLRTVLRRVLTARTVLMVTHDVLDAVMLADRLIVLENGRIAEDGPVSQVLARPRSRFAARVSGLNAVFGTIEGTSVRTPDGLRIEGLLADQIPDGRSAVAVFAPRVVSVYRDAPHGSPRNVLQVAITQIVPQEGHARLRAGDLAADVVWESVSELGLVPGMDVHLVVKANEVAIHPM